MCRSQEKPPLQTTADQQLASSEQVLLTTMSTSILDQLPVELLYRIFDHLDVQTIVFSLRCVCKQLYLTANSYDRYNFNFKSISKPLFHVVCRLIPFEQAIALTLSNKDKTRGQIEAFVATYSIHQFQRLQSLTLLQIDSTSLNHLLPYILISSLRSLSISINTLHVAQTTTPAQLSAVLVHHSLTNLCLNIADKDWNDVSWSTNRTLRYLRIVNSITFRQFRLILQHYVGLRTLVLKQVHTDDRDEDLTCSTFEHLTSLTFDEGHIEINRIAQCLSLTPSLTYLKIIGDGNLFNSSFDGYQWEKLIRTRLPRLVTFEFFFVILTYSNYRSRNIELLMQSFHTLFWLDEMHCSITCDYSTNSRRIMLYTLPVCKTHFVYHVDPRKFSVSNFNARFNQIDMDNVQELELQLTKDVNSSLVAKSAISNHVLFRNVTSLTVGNDGEWPKGSLRFLSAILDLSRIVKLSLSINFLCDQTSNTVWSIKQLLAETSNLRSLLLYDYWAPDNYMPRMETICSMISPTIKHLQIRVKNLEDIKHILERLQDLTRVTFEYAQILTIDRQQFTESLAYLDRSISSWDSQHALHVWLRNSSSTT